jgi:hypothetical protein
MDPAFRRTIGAHLLAPVAAAIAELEAYIGRSLSFWERQHALRLGGASVRFSRHRSLAAVALATHFERRGLKWKAFDPGPRELAYWRKRFCEEGRDPPRVVAISTTFSLNSAWLAALCRLVRESLPSATLVVGGYYYATNTRHFLSFDADVFCVGEGELRLPEIVSSLRDGRPLDPIPGLYLRDDAGALRYTGHAEPLELEALPHPDWRLAARIEPPVDLDDDSIEFGVETQRGCVFRCEFCTYRTLARPQATSIEYAVDAILSTGISRRGFINILDATATFPHNRWQAILEELVRRGGAPHPVWAYARVSDISDAVARRMAAAGVRHIFIGQESGDQRILDAMKKGTNVRQVGPAIAALGMHGITATFSLIHGFPGETSESVAATRALIASVNDGFERAPVVTGYTPFPFIYSDFASVSRDESLKGADHYLNYGSAPMSPERAAEEVIMTILATSRVSHAPPALLLFEGSPPTTGISLFGGRNRWHLFRWMKAMDRGVAVLLERDLEGKRPRPGELKAVRDELLSGYETSQSQLRSMTERLKALAKARLVARLGQEWSVDVGSRPGFLTRAILAGVELRDRAALGAGWRAWRGEAVPPRKAMSHPEDTARDALAASLIEAALSAPVKLRLSRVRSDEPVPRNSPTI